MKQPKCKYRYYYKVTSNQLVRFPFNAKLTDECGQYFSKRSGSGFLKTYSCYSLDTFLNEYDFKEVTLSQGFHYLKGNYVE